MNLRNLDLEDLRALCRKEEEPPYRAVQIADWLYKKDALDFSDLKNLPAGFLDRIGKSFSVSSLTQAKDLHSKDGSRKFLFKTDDGHFLESVFIPSGGRGTVCLSTQLGCKMKCVFCASGKGPFIRNLSVAEMLDQLSLARRIVGKPVTNVVFMGMGEPLDNARNLFKAIRIIHAPWGYNLGSRRITVSTFGFTPGLRQFVKEKNLPPVRLSLSLHSSDPARREKLMPAARQFPLDDIYPLLRKYREGGKREITLEYLTIGGINDSNSDAEGVARIAKFLKAKVNLISFNAVEKCGWRPPSEDEIEKFRKRLEARGVRTTIRKSVGSDIHAACGQLRLKG